MVQFTYCFPERAIPDIWDMFGTNEQKQSLSYVRESIHLPVLSAIMKPTPTENTLTMRTGGFATLAEALDYAARGETGFNFYSGKGQLQDVLTYTELKQKAQTIAGRLLSLGLERGARVALIADTEPDFVIFIRLPVCRNGTGTVAGTQLPWRSSGL